MTINTLLNTNDRISDRPSNSFVKLKEKNEACKAPKSFAEKTHLAMILVLKLLVLLVPIFFLPFTQEIFEFNKVVLVIACTSLCLILWGIQVFIAKSLRIAKTNLLFPLFLVILSVTVSTIFSIDKTSSVFGASGRWYPSLISLFSLGTLYIVMASQIRGPETNNYEKQGQDAQNEVNKLLGYFFSGVTLSGIITILSFYGLFTTKGIDQNFSPTGSLLTLGILAVLAVFFFTQNLIHCQNNEKPTKKMITSFAVLINFLYISLLGNPKIWILLMVSFALLAVTIKKSYLKTNKIYLAITGILAGLIFASTIIPFTKNRVLPHTYPQEVQLPFGISWNVAISTMRDFPIAGTGPSTFYLNYPRYKPLEMNQTENWDLRFEKPYNEFLLVISSLGLMGILCVGYFLVTTIKTAFSGLFLSQAEKTEESKMLSALTILVIISLGFTHATVPLAFALTLFLGLLGSLETKSPLEFKAQDTNEKFWTIVLPLPLITLALLGFASIYSIYPAEYYMQKAIKLLNSNAQESYNYQLKAISLNPHRSNYYNVFAQTNLMIAKSLLNQGNSTAENSETVKKETVTIAQKLIPIALNASKTSTEQVNPLNPANWEIRAEIYKAITGVAKDANQWAIKAMESAIQLDPTNPRLRMDLGGIYYAQADYPTAENYFRQAINLKPDYANAYYNFAQVAIKLEDYASAKRALELAATLVDKNSKDAEKLRQEIADVTEKMSKLENPAEEEQKPSVEELTNQAKVQEAVTEGEKSGVESEVNNKAKNEKSEVLQYNENSLNE